MASNSEDSEEKTGKPTVLVAHRSLPGWPSLETGITEKGLTLESFAVQIGRTERGVMAWIYGEQKPNIHTLMEIGKLLDVDVARLLADCPKLLKQMEPTAAPATVSAVLEST